MRNFLAITYVWLPVVVAMVSVIGSLLISVRARNIANYILTIFVCVAVLWSLYTLYEVFALEDYHALWYVVHGKALLLKYLPQTVILVAFGVFATQAFRYKPNGT